MVDLIIMVASLAISAVGSICVPVCTRSAQTDVVEHVIIVDERALDLKDVELKDSSTETDIDSSK